MGKDISLSLEETNRLRVSIGLKPIPIPKVASERELRSRGDELPEEPRRKRTKLQPVKIQYVDEEESRQDDEEMSTMDFLNQLDQIGKQEKANTHSNVKATPTIQEQPIPEVSVSHLEADIEALESNTVLTLGDKSIFVDGEDEDDDEGDELVNEKIILREKTRAREEEERKIADRHHRKFGGFMEEELQNDLVLAPSKGIRIVSHVAANDKLKSKEESKTESLKHIFEEDQEELDQSRPETKKSFKRIKKKEKKKKIDRLDNIFDENSADVPSIQEVKLENFHNQGPDEEDEFSNLMSLQRRRRQQQSRGKMKAEDIALEIKKLQRNEELEDEISSAFVGGIIYDDNSEFLNSLSSRVLPIDNNKAEETEETEITTPMEPTQAVEKQNESPIKKEEEKVKTATRTTGDTTGDKTDVNPDLEQVIGDGIGSTLRLLQQRNILQVQDEERAKSERVQRVARRKAELMRFQISVEERILEEELSKDKSYKKLSKEEKEKRYETLLDERLQAKNLVNGTSEITSFNPKVVLQYKDDEGKELDTKGAFKHLSHKFHGSKKR